MRPVIVAGCIALASALPAHARPATGDTIKSCARELVPYGERARNPDQWSLDLKAPSGGRLVYFGAQHSRDAAHPQFAELTETWRNTNPTVAFYEGPDRGVGATATETITSFGESGYVRFLAQKSGARIERLEPSPQQEIAAMAERFPVEQIKLFYILREAARLRDREGKTGEQLNAAMTTMMQRAQTLLGEQFGPPWTLDDLQSAFKRNWTSPAAWSEAPSDWFDPARSGSETGGRFTNEINRASSEFRDRHMYEVLAKAVLAGDVVFAVVGRDHVPSQAAALRCALR